MRSKYSYCLCMVRFLILVQVTTAGDHNYDGQHGLIRPFAHLPRLKISTRIRQLFERLFDDGCQLRVAGEFDSTSKTQAYDEDIESFMFLLTQGRSPIILMTPVSVWSYPDLAGRMRLAMKDISSFVKYPKCHVEVLLLMGDVNGQTRGNIARHAIIQDKEALTSISLVIFVSNKQITVPEKISFYMDLQRVRGFQATCVNILQAVNDSESRIEVIIPHRVAVRPFPVDVDMRDSGAFWSAMNHVWFALHKNRQGFPVLVAMISPATAEQESNFGKMERGLICGDQHSSKFSADDCLQLELLSKFNFSGYRMEILMSTKEGRESKYQNTFGMLSWFHVVTDLMLDDHLRQCFDVLFINVVPYHIIVVLDKNYISAVNMQALISSMDLSTWIYGLLSVVAIIVLAYYWLPTPAGDSPIAWACWKLIGVFAITVGQGSDLPTAKMRWVLRLVFTTWLLATIVISNGYSGILISLATRPVIPPHPKSLDELISVKNSFPMFTFSQALVVEFNGSTEMIPDKPNLWNGTNSEKSKYSSMLDSVIYPIPAKTLEEKLKNLREAVINEEVTTISHGHELKIRKIPKNFALLEGFSFNTVLNTAKHGLESEKLVPFVGPAYPFVYVRHISVSSNYLHRLAKPSIRGLIESGIYYMWQRFAREQDEISIKKQRRDYYPDLEQERVKAPVIMSLPAPQPRPRKGSMQLYSIPFTVFGALILFSTFAFFLECAY